MVLHQNLVLLIHVLTLFLIPKFLSAKIDIFLFFSLFRKVGALVFHVRSAKRNFSLHDRRAEGNFSLHARCANTNALSPIARSADDIFSLLGKRTGAVSREKMKI